MSFEEDLHICCCEFTQKRTNMLLKFLSLLNRFWKPLNFSKKRQTIFYDIGLLLDSDDHIGKSIKNFQNIAPQRQIVLFYRFFLNPQKNLQILAQPLAVIPTGKNFQPLRKENCEAEGWFTFGCALEIAENMLKDQCNCLDTLAWTHTISLNHLESELNAIECIGGIQ